MSTLAERTFRVGDVAKWSCVLGVLAAASAGAQQTKQRQFERVFGEAVRLDPALVAKVKAMPPGERLLIDRDGDGKNDEAWYIDTAARHQAKAKPLLVRAIDEDGDLDEHKGPDLDSDLYVGDWNADGQVDAVVDYQDNDGDNDVDEMGMYFVAGGRLQVWWGCDDGDDNLLWYDVNLNYQQADCQYRSHFSGDEHFVRFALADDADRWIAHWENPFIFYDPDGDRCAEVVIRFSGYEDRVESLRYSFDADDDAFGRRTHDYDFSITAIAPGTKWLGQQKGDVPCPSELMLTDDVTASRTLRGVPTGRYLQREHARQFAARAPWARAVLTWDEVNANTDGDVRRDPHERWEGVIAHPSADFPQIGGPPCSAVNKRNEVSLRPEVPLRLYYDPSDRRLHLKGANQGWLDVDFDFDGKVDAKYAYVDEDRDGVFDRRTLDLDADGRADFDWRMGSGTRDVELEFAKLATFYKATLAQTLADSQRFIDVTKAALAAEPGKAPADPAKAPASAGNGPADPVEAFFLTELEAWMPEAGLGARMRKTPAGARFYMDLLRDRLLYRLKQRFGQRPAWVRVESLYAAGDYRAAAHVVATQLVPGAKPINPLAFGSFTRRVPIRLETGPQGPRADWAVTIAVRDIKAAAGDFNPDHCAVVAPQRWIGWRQIPHQVDEIDATVGGEISFLADLDAGARETYYLYYTPTGKSGTQFAARTGTAEDWVPPNMGWESGRAAYRAYWGQFDFFGKKVDRLIYKGIGAKSYHDEVDWGIDALLVGKTSGIGGLTIYLDDRAYPVQNPGGEGKVAFKKRMLTSGPVRAAVEITAGNVVPTKPELTVRMLCLIYAERQETEIRVSTAGAHVPVLLAPGFIKLAREEAFSDPAAGCFGTWGYQAAVIDEIGMGLIASPDAFVSVVDRPDERRFKLRTSPDGKLRYWLIGDWRRGRQHPVAPTADNWHKELQGLARLLLNDVEVTIGQPERVR